MPQSNAQRLQSHDHGQHATGKANGPVDKFHDGPVHVSIWENQGAKGAFRTATFDLRYKDTKDEWQTGHSYTASDLMYLEVAAREARSRINSWREANQNTPALRR